MDASHSPPPLPEPYRTRLVALIRARRAKGAAQLLGVPLATIKSAAAGCAIRAGSALMIRLALERLDAADRKVTGAERDGGGR